MANIIDDPDTFKSVIDNIPLHVVITDPEGIILYANKASEAITGYTFEEMSGKSPKLWGGLMEKSFYEKMWRVIKIDKQIFISIVNNKRKNGKLYMASIKIAPILDQDKSLIGFCGIEQDLTEILNISDEFEIDRRQNEILGRSLSLNSKTHHNH